jgi:hypothetical protein
LPPLPIEIIEPVYSAISLDTSRSIAIAFDLLATWTPLDICEFKPGRPALIGHFEAGEYDSTRLPHCPDVISRRCLPLTDLSSQHYRPVDGYAHPFRLVVKSSQSSDQLETACTFGFKEGRQAILKGLPFRP